MANKKSQNIVQQSNNRWTTPSIINYGIEQNIITKAEGKICELILKQYGDPHSEINRLDIKKTCLSHNKNLHEQIEWYNLFINNIKDFIESGKIELLTKIYKSKGWKQFPVAFPKTVKTKKLYKDVVKLYHETKEKIEIQLNKNVLSKQNTSKNKIEKTEWSGTLYSLANHLRERHFNKEFSTITKAYEYGATHFLINGKSTTVAKLKGAYESAKNKGNIM